MAALVFQTLFSSSSGEGVGGGSALRGFVGNCRLHLHVACLKCTRECHFLALQNIFYVRYCVTLCVWHIFAVFWAYYRSLKGATGPLLPESRGKSLRS
uniref:Uncharacterized protein n=1 Tax=Anopheles darlingi TaxID=43151 RepID=A0A2M4DHU6_ANODA